MAKFGEMPKSELVYWPMREKGGRWLAWGRGRFVSCPWSVVRCRKIEVRDQRSEVGDQRTEDRGQKTEVGDQRSEVGRQLGTRD